MKIALDAMGGDHAPAAIVAGGLEAARMDHGQYEVVFVGDQAAIEAEIEKHHRFKASGLAYSIVHASEKIDMCDSATTALKKSPMHRFSSVSNFIAMAKCKPLSVPDTPVQPWLQRSSRSADCRASIDHPWELFCPRGMESPLF